MRGSRILRVAALVAGLLYLLNRLSAYIRRRRRWEEGAAYRPKEHVWKCSRCGAKKEREDETLMDHYAEEHPGVLRP